MSPVADLHVHTIRSDGSLAPSEVPAAAREVGIEAVAITDHDRLQTDIDHPVTVRDGVTVIHGLELRVDAGAFRVDLLGYGVRPTPALTAELDRVQRDRIERGRRIIECIESRLGVDLDLKPREGLGRPHIARAVEESAADCDFQGAFDRLIGSDCPCYVPRDVTEFERGAELLADACEVVSLAHPFRYPDPEGALALTRDLDAVERHYPYGWAVDETLLDSAVQRYDLLVTGGSDAHGTELGGAGLDREAFERVRERLPPVSE